MHFSLIRQLRYSVILLMFLFASVPLSLSAFTTLYSKAKVVVFDCDGVLVDTEYLKFLSWQEALASQNINFSIEEYMPLVGHSSNNILEGINRAKGLQLTQQIIVLKDIKYKALQKEGVKAIQPMVDFARDLFLNKTKLGLRLALASSGTKEEILINLYQVGLENAFDVVISGSDDLDDYVDTEGKNKPKPYIYLEVAKRLNIDPEQCLVFEDSEAGVEAAFKAGMTVIAVPNAYTCLQDFSKASDVLSSHTQLPCNEIFQKKLTEDTSWK